MFHCNLYFTILMHLPFACLLGTKTQWEIMGYVGNLGKYLWQPKAAAGVIFFLLKLDVWFWLQNNTFLKLEKLESKQSDCVYSIPGQYSSKMWSASESPVCWLTISLHGPSSSTKSEVTFSELHMYLFRQNEVP